MLLVLIALERYKVEIIDSKISFLLYLWVKKKKNPSVLYMQYSEKCFEEVKSTI